jgi:hypothetical protein
MNSQTSIDQKSCYTLLLEALENAHDWSYVEHEGPSTVRFDFGSRSLWVYPDSLYYSGKVPSKEVKAVLDYFNVEDDSILY